MTARTSLATHESVPGSDFVVLSAKSLPSLHDLEAASADTVSDLDTVQSFSDSEAEDSEESMLAKFHRRFEGLSPSDFKCEVAVLAPGCHEASTGFTAHWHATANSLEAHMTSVNVVLMFADVMDESEFAECKRAIESFDHVYDAAALVLLPHSPKGIHDRELLGSKWSELLQMGLEDVCCSEPCGFDLLLWVRSFQSKQRMLLLRVEAQLESRRQRTHEAVDLKHATNYLLWDYVARRVAPALPLSEHQLPEGIPRSLDGFNFKEKLGSGAFGSVYLVQRGSEPVEVIKAIQKRQFKSVGEVRSAAANVQLMLSLSTHWQHNNIVQFLAAYQSTSHLFCRFEFAGNHNLCWRLKRRDGSVENKLTPDKCHTMIAQLASALGLLHEGPQVCHLDVKPENVIVFDESEDSIEIKLADFDMAVVQLTEKRCQGVCGTVPFFAPEMLSMRNYDGMAADVWSLGVVLLEVQCSVGVLERSFCTREKGVEIAERVHCALSAPDAVQSILQRHCQVQTKACAGTILLLAEGLLATAPEQRWSATAVSDYLIASTLRRRARAA